jgi:hypothetical protein
LIIYVDHGAERLTLEMYKALKVGGCRVELVLLKKLHWDITFTPF